MARVLVAIFVALLPGAVVAQQPIGGAGDEATETAYSVSVLGSAVDAKVKTTFAYQQDGAKLYAKGSSTLDLSDLQRKLPLIVGTLDFPRNACQRFAADNVVVSPQAAALVMMDSKLTLKISGSSSVWACLENPLPETKLVWKTQQIAPGLKTQIPVAVSSAGAPIKTRLLQGQFEWSAPLVWVPSGKPQTVGGAVVLKDSIGRQIFKDDERAQWSDSLSVPVEDQFSKAIAPVFDINKIVPSTLSEQRPMIESIEWVNEDGHLGARVRWATTVPTGTGQQTVKDR